MCYFIVYAKVHYPFLSKTGNKCVFCFVTIFWPKHLARQNCVMQNLSFASGDFLILVLVLLLLILWLFLLLLLLLWMKEGRKTYPS